MYLKVNVERDRGRFIPIRVLCRINPIKISET